VLKQTAQREPEAMSMFRQARLLQWPDQRAERPAMVAARQPCIWLVESGKAPPGSWALWEDWVRLPADEQEMAARVAAVELRSRALPSSAYIDEFDVLRNRASWVALSPLEARLMRVLLDHERAVVRRKHLIEVAWPGADRTGANDLNTPIKVLRRKVDSVGIAIHTIAGRGYLVEVAGRGSVSGAG
jgi:Transcriptional regulatory protein, C terminal